MHVPLSTTSRPTLLLNDFGHRLDPLLLAERMDGPCSPEDLAACLRDLARINRLFLSYRPTLGFLQSAAERNSTEVLRVVDVGSGFGDTLRQIYRWAARRQVRVHLTGIDLHPHSAAAARAQTEREELPPDAITWITGDAYTLPGTPAPDVIISSLLTHHLTDPEIVRFLGWMEGTARLGWFINDLERQPMPARLFSVLARTLRWHPFVQHDGPLSFRRAFRVADWTELLAQAGIASTAARIVPTFPARLCVSRLRAEPLNGSEATSVPV